MEISVESFTGIPQYFSGWGRVMRRNKSKEQEREMFRVWKIYSDFSIKKYRFQFRDCYLLILEFIYFNLKTSLNKKQ